MTDKCFIDTNLFIYALTDPRDELDQAKHIAALSFFKETIRTFDIFTSVQVLNESHSILTRKFKIPDSDAYDLVLSAICNISTVQSLTVGTYKLAASLRTGHHISFWDSLIMATALESESSYLFSEDMQHDKQVAGQLIISNPFK